MKTHKFARKPFYVDAVRVSESNMEEVAKWCDGKIETNDDGTHIKVEVYRPFSDRQTQAYVGDWVLFAGSGFKVYTSKAFDKQFEKVKTLTKQQADEAGIKPPHEPRQPKKAIKFEEKRRPKPAPPKNPVLPPNFNMERDNEAIAEEKDPVIHRGPVIHNTQNESKQVAADKLIEEVLGEDPRRA